MPYDSALVIPSRLPPHPSAEGAHGKFTRNFATKQIVKRAWRRIRGTSEPGALLPAGGTVVLLLGDPLTVMR